MFSWSKSGWRYQCIIATCQTLELYLGFVPKRLWLLCMQYSLRYNSLWLHGHYKGFTPLTTLTCRHSLSTLAVPENGRKWSLPSSASVQNPGQISVHSPVQSPESRFYTYPKHRPSMPRPNGSNGAHIHIHTATAHTYSNCTLAWGHAHKLN